MSDELEGFVLDRYPDEMLNIHTAIEIAIAFLKHRDPFSGVAMLADSFNRRNVATVHFCLPFANAWVGKEENFNQGEREILVDKTFAIQKALRRNQNVDQYFDQAHSMSDEESQQFLSAFLHVGDFEQQYEWASINRKILSPSVDYYLAKRAFQAYMEDKFELEEAFQKTRYYLRVFTAKITGNYDL